MTPYEQLELFSEPELTRRMAENLAGQETGEERDAPRLGRQLVAVLRVMQDGKWHTLAGLAHATGHPEASISARLRDLRKPRFGRAVVERKRSDGGLFWYRLAERSSDHDHAEPR